MVSVQQGLGIGNGRWLIVAQGLARGWSTWDWPACSPRASPRGLTPWPRYHGDTRAPRAGVPRETEKLLLGSHRGPLPLSCSLRPSQRPVQVQGYRLCLLIEGYKIFMSTAENHFLQDVRKALKKASKRGQRNSC